MTQNIRRKNVNTAGHATEHRGAGRSSMKKSSSGPQSNAHHVHHETRPESYKSGLLEVDKQEEKYDKLFEQKLAEQYKEFRNLKEHHLQIRKLIRIFAVVVTIILIALLVMSFG